MRTSWRGRVAASVMLATGAAVVLAAVGGSGGAGAGVPPAPRPAVGGAGPHPAWQGNDAFDGAPPEVASAGANQWPLPGHDYDNTRDAGVSSIDASDVHELTTAWTVPMSGDLTTAPIVLGDRVYAEDDDGAVVAVDRDTGRVLWHSAPTGATLGPAGVTVGWGDVFATTYRGVEALNADTGAVVWTRRLTTTPTEGVDIQPTVVDDLVLAATVPVSLRAAYHGGDRGWLFALRASDGATVWKFDTVASSDLWGDPTVNSGGGAWYPPSIDASAGRVYWGTANPAPYPGTPQYPNGSSRPGRNLYTDSTLALELGSGHLVWYHQATAHDLRDYDFVHTMIVDLPGPSHRDVVVGTGKSGVVVGLDPRSGRLLWRTEVGVHRHDTSRALKGRTLVFPGTFGGVLTPPASADGIVYVATLNDGDRLSPDEDSYHGGRLGERPGDIVAIDAATGAVLWSTSVPGDPTGAATVVDDLVLTATFQGTLVAIDRADGRIIWEDTLPGPVNGWMSISHRLVVVPVERSSGHELVALRLPDPPRSR
jgi:outer membrane protein assembly factor BamB